MAFQLDPIGANVWRRSGYEVPAMTDSYRETDPIAPIFDSDYHQGDDVFVLTPSKLLSLYAPEAKITLDALLVDRIELTEAESLAEALPFTPDGPDNVISIEAARGAAAARRRVEDRYAELCQQIVMAIKRAGERGW